MKRVYSLNLAAYLISNGNFKYNIVRDEDNLNKFYLVFDEDIGDLKQKYKQDVELQKFLKCFKELKLAIRNFK